MRRGWPRSGALFGVSLGCLLLLCWLWGWSSIGAWFAAGLVGGLLGGRYSRVWVVWLAAIAYAPLSVWLGLADLTDITGHRWPLGQAVLVAIVGCAITLGYITGVAVALRGQAWPRLRSEWHGVGRRPRVGAGAVVLGVTAFLIGYVAFVGVMGSELWLSAGGEQDCRTPGFAYGWTYEAVNYDAADDQNLQPQKRTDGTWICPSQGSKAGDEVVTTDIVAIAGWYIPAAAGTGPSGPTLIVVPGGKSNKSGMLKYLPALHDRYNLVVLDDRGMGRSGDGRFAFGLFETQDVSAMLDWLVREKHPAWIGGLGNSMGAAAVLAAAAGEVRIRALALDSMHASVEFATGRVLETEWAVPALPGAWALITGSSLRLGHDVTTVDPINKIVQLGNRPVLLIHGTDDVIDVPEQSVELNFRAALAAGVPVELRYCRGGTHGMLPDPPTDALPDGCGADWARWVSAFFDDALAQP